MRDRRSACSVMIARPPVRGLGRQLLRVAADARERRLEVVRDAAEEVVLGLVQRQEPRVLVLHPGVQLGVADGRGDLDREQLEQVLVGPFPAPRRRQVAHGDAQHLPRGREDGPHRPRLAGHDLLVRDLPGIHEPDVAVDHPEGRPGALARVPGQDVRPLVERRCRECVEDLPQLPVPPLQDPGEPVVALGQAAELVVAGQVQRGREVARGHPLDRAARSPAAARTGPRRAPPRAARRTRRRPRPRAAAPARPSCSPWSAAPVTSRTTTPNPATGRTAAAISPSVSRVRKPSPDRR